MEPTINTPYTAPPKGEKNGLPYFNDGPNRRQRRESYHASSGSMKNKMLVTPTGRYRMVYQQLTNGIITNVIKHALLFTAKLFRNNRKGGTLKSKSGKYRYEELMDMKK